MPTPEAPAASLSRYPCLLLSNVPTPSMLGCSSISMFLALRAAHVLSAPSAEDVLAGVGSPLLRRAADRCCGDLCISVTAPLTLFFWLQTHLLCLPACLGAGRPSLCLALGVAFVEEERKRWHCLSKRHSRAQVASASLALSLSIAIGKAGSDRMERRERSAQRVARAARTCWRLRNTRLLDAAALVPASSRMHNA